MTVLNAREFLNHLDSCFEEGDFRVNINQIGLHKVMIIYRDYQKNITIDPYEYRPQGWQLSNVHYFPELKELRAVYRKMQLS